MDDHLPNIAHAKAWLTEMRTDLLAARESLRTGHAGATRVVADTLEKHAATLGDIIARANVVDRYRVELPTVEQANALRRGRRERQVASVQARPFDLPADYLLVTYDDGFTCGIAPDGSVSS